MKRTLGTLALCLFACACGTAPQPTNIVQVSEGAMQPTIAALEHFSGRKVQDGARQLEIAFVRAPGDLSVGDTCKCVAFTSILGPQEFYVEVALVDELGQAPLDPENPQAIGRSPLVHELIHVLYGDTKHGRLDLWGAHGLNFKVYDSLNNTHWWSE